MYKLKLEPVYNTTLVQGTENWSLLIREHVQPQYFTDEMAEWIFENITGLFIVDNGHILFKNDEDALAFKLRWK